jgi:hypothetical protein
MKTYKVEVYETYKVSFKFKAENDDWAKIKALDLAEVNRPIEFVTSEVKIINKNENKNKNKNIKTRTIP